ncbi:unnamed protein product [Rotaria magnacalcarata]|uniref:CAP-Gly domain-containing protein n=1 Tax=Rotaria magnacalcarata TaxID=392030 RepID=A0A8S2LK27_9BILA|nr:unnamed protein product [Rotaria magnacalcarata]
MPTKIEGRSSSHDLIDDIVEAPSSSSFMSNSISSTMMDTSKILPARHYSSYSNLPSLFNNKSKLEQTDGSSTLLTNELRDRLHLTLPRSSSSSTMVSNDERRKELDLVLKHLYDGKLLTSMHDDRPSSDISEATIPMLTKGPITKTTTTIIKSDDESKHNVGSIEMLSLDDDCTSLQRELQEKELDIMHLSKEIQELQLENKLLKAKVPVLYQNGHTTNNSETEALRREKDVLQNELRAQQELVAKIQQQQHQNGVVARSNKFDEASIYQREALEKKLKAYEKQMHVLANENDKLKQNVQQTDRTITQLKRENEELQLKVTEAKKRNDELLYQEFNSLRNDLKMLKLQNNELFEENHRLQKDQQRQQQNLAWRATLQQAFSTEPLPAPSQQPQQQQQLQQQQQQQILPIENVPTSSPLKLSTTDQRRERSKITMRSESPNLSEGSDSTNYLTTVSVERYNNRPITSIHRSATIDGNNHHRTTRYDPMVGQEEYHRNSFSSATSKSMDPQLNYRSSKTKRSVEWDEENIQQNEDRHQGRHRRPSVETTSPRRPYAPSSISDIRLNDIVKFSRPGGKISKGVVKYIGTLPGKNDQYLGLELEDEESKHDGIYQGQRLFQCKANKGVFVGFSKVIMAWSGK